MAQAFVQMELEDPGALVLYTVRIDRWLTSDFSDEGA
jgi:hypothetical protein